MSQNWYVTFYKYVGVYIYFFNTLFFNIFYNIYIECYVESWFATTTPHVGSS